MNWIRDFEENTQNGLFQYFKYGKVCHLYCQKLLTRKPRICKFGGFIDEFKI